MVKRKSNDILRFAVVVAIILVLNIIGGLKFFRVDLTSENRYSLSDATKELLQSFDDILYIKVYLEGGDFPADFQRLQRETRQMLDEFRAYNSNIEYEFIDPSNNETAEINQQIFQQLQTKGLKYYELQVAEADGEKTQRVFPGAIFNYGEKEMPVQLLIDQLGASPTQQVNASVQNLEYTLANAVKSLTVPLKKNVGFLQGHGELEPNYIADFARALGANYSLNRFNIREFKTDSSETEFSISDQQIRLNRFDAIVIAKPEKRFTDLDKYLLDQYIMTGGKVLWLIDAVFANMDSLSQAPQFISYPILDRLDLGDLLFKYGARINTNLVQDIVSAGINDRRETRPWMYFPMVLPQVKHPIAKDLNAIKLQFPSSVDTIIAKGIKKTFLLKSSPYSNTVATPHIVKLQMLYNPPEESRFTQSNVPMAVLLEGQFESAYKNRVTPRGNGQNLKLVEKSPPNKMLVVADGDIIKNQLNIVNPNLPKGAPLPLGFDQFTGAQYGNKEFLLNAMDYLLDDSGLIDIRRRELRIRLLDAAKVRDSKLKWQIVNTVLPVVLVILLGIFYSFFRKRKYAR